MAKRGRKGFDEAFRREAVRLADTGKMPLTQVARDLGIHLETLRGWRRKARAAAEPGEGAESLEEQNRRLRRENARLQEERDILKKATAFFAKDAR